MKKVNKQENQNNIARFIGNNNKVEQNNYINPVTIDSNFLLDITKKQHKLYPYFFTGMDKLPNGKFGYKSIPASKEAEIKFPLSIQSNVTVIDEKYKGYTDLNKILKESYNNQEPIKVKVNSTIQKLGDEIDPYQPFEGEEIVEAYIFPQKFPHVPIISIGFTNSDFIVDGIQLEIVKKEGDNITYLNNKKQDCFIIVEMKVTVSNVNKEKQCADMKFNFNFNINERYKENLDANITFYKIKGSVACWTEEMFEPITKENPMPKLESGMFIKNVFGHYGVIAGEKIIYHNGGYDILSRAIARDGFIKQVIENKCGFGDLPSNGKIIWECEQKENAE